METALEKEVIYFPAVQPELTVQFIENLKDFKDSDIEEWVQRISPFKFLHIPCSVPHHSHNEPASVLLYNESAGSPQ
ncbi:27030_t:CDS:2 [Dentiscutata erythropus]|uniref:27030_t:CDS:1 n=1 Tax=Dentiscutata erythropus TaxID=1348616 RepID=A0A9N9BYQ9_9GLOM|nr:27030_t:CDS:2 [Dentiscutata erythropus]